MSEASSRTQIEHTPPPDEASIAGQAVAALHAGLGDRLVAVVLFGSRARGDARPDSDWDLLVIADGLPEKRFDRHLSLKRLLPPMYRGAISLIARTPAEFEEHLPSLYLDIALDGRILHDPQGYAADRLLSLHRLISHKGLRREQTANGDVWRWDSPARQPWHLEWSASDGTPRG